MIRRPTRIRCSLSINARKMTPHKYSRTQIAYVGETYFQGALTSLARRPTFQVRTSPAGGTGLSPGSLKRPLYAAYLGERERAEVETLRRLGRKSQEASFNLLLKVGSLKINGVYSAIKKVSPLLSNSACTHSQYSVWAGQVSGKPRSLASIALSQNKPLDAAKPGHVVMMIVNTCEMVKEGGRGKGGTDFKKRRGNFMPRSKLGGQEERGGLGVRTFTLNMNKGNTKFLFTFRGDHGRELRAVRVGVSDKPPCSTQ